MYHLYAENVYSSSHVRIFLYVDATAWGPKYVYRLTAYAVLCTVTCLTVPVTSFLSCLVHEPQKKREELATCEGKNDQKNNRPLFKHSLIRDMHMQCLDIVILALLEAVDFNKYISM